MKKKASPERYHRPDPRRIEPHRAASGTASGKPSAKHRRESDESDEDSDQSRFGWTGQGMRDAHRVVEEHLRSRRQAQGFHDPRGFQSPFYHMPGGRGAGAMDQMMRLYIDLMNCVVSMISAGPLARPHQYPGDYYPPPELHRHDRVTRVSIETNSTVGIITTSTKTTLDIEAPHHADLLVQPLVAIDLAKPSIDNVELHFKNHRPVLKISIPEDQPEGIYTGAIVDAETDDQYGKLTVRIAVYQ